MTSTSLIPRLFLALALTGLLGCKQEEGDTCLADDNCSGSLICACKSGAADRGMCMADESECGDPPPEEVDLGPIPEVDLGTDLGTDMGSDDMGAVDDAGAESDLGVDEDMGADEDMGPDDMGTEPDLGDEDMGA